MEIIKRNKTAQRTSFTKAYSKLENALLGDDLEEIEMCLHLLKQKANALESTHSNYLDALTDESEFNSEFNIVEEYREKALRMEIKSKQVLENIKKQANDNERTESASNSRLIIADNQYKSISPRLPEVELYKFGGDLKDWLTFWNQFKSIHENKSLTDSDKFHYLIQSTKVKSEAREIVESFPVTNENYPLAIESLTERYGRKELLIDFYIRELLKLVLNNATKKKQDSLSALYNKLSTQLRALSSLGVTTDQCGIILYPLVESSLPTHILRSFERQRKHIESEQNLSSLDAIISFLKDEVQSEERIKLSRSEIYSYSHGRNQFGDRQCQRSLPAAAELAMQESNGQCIFCLKDHESRFCKKAFYIPLDEKIAIIKKKGLCRICLIKGHVAFKCRSQIMCQLCSKRHLKFMCPNIECNKSNPPKQDISGNTINDSVDSLHSRATNEVILQTLVVYVQGVKKKRNARAIIDTGSQKSYILRSTAEELGFNLERKEEFCHSLFGGTKTEMYKHNCYKIYLSNLDGNYTCKLDALDHNVICSDISSIKNGSWIDELKTKKIFLTDIRENAGPIEILLGADVAGKLITGRREELSTGLVALETKLGWTLMGKVPKCRDQKDASMNIVTMLSQADIPVSALWDLELLGIRDPIEQSSRVEMKEAVMNHFRETVRQNEDGRYEVHLPWKVNHTILSNNYELCLKRLESTTRRLEKIGYREKYHDVFEEWLKEEVIEEVPREELALPAHYLPHRPVIKDTSTTSSMKIRPVFDASAKIPKHPSLNNCLETGNNLIETIPSILARFRLKQIGVISDIRRAFLQISLHEKDRNFVRFLWYDNEGNIRTFRHARVVFGITSSPFLLMAVINYHLSKESIKERYSEEFREKLRESFYVDNCVTSVRNTTELKEFVESATNVMKEGMFDLRGWESSAIPASPESAKALVLGLIWDKHLDTLEIDSESLKFDEKEKVTKRKMLSLVSRVFDPIGFLSPAMIQPKVLLQVAWKTKESWDDEVNDEIKKKFLKWSKQLKYFKDIKIPRWLGVMEKSSLSIHTFVDASKTAYAACVFLRSETNTGSVTVQLLQAKARIAPMKKITIPRLELMAATIGARLFSSVKQALKFQIRENYFWSDSSTVLAWITRQEQWTVFVSNRISEIRTLTASEDWLHISTNQNPADILSRGCEPKQLQNCKWWEGPTWLRNSKEQWPKSAINVNEKEIEIERRKSVISANNTELETIPIRLARRFSKFSKMIRVLAWILRFQPKAKNLRKYTELKNDELINAQKILFRLVQKESYSNEETRKSLKGLQVFEDEVGILRLKSRLINAEESEDFISPMILPSKHLAVKRFIAQEHIANKHASIMTLLTILRERFWIVNGKRCIRNVIKDCLTCKKQRVKNLEVPFPPLPKDRTEVAAVFQVSGTDLAGPLLTKTNQKVWIVIFTCAVFRAVHLELIPSLSTSDYIQAMRRFIARRGRISVMYSDNGTNFTGLNNALKKLDWTTIESEFGIKQIRWKFNPPSSPWWGGFFERLIGILKDLLRKNLGKSSLSYEELQTLICECESVMNNRPLTYVSEEQELKTLTPSMFLQDLPLNNVSDLDQIERTNVVKRWRHIQKVRENLKQRFKREYLGFLRSSVAKKEDKIKIGDIVLVGTDNKKRLHWLLGRVVHLFPGKDGIVRLVELQTQKGNILRPIQRLYPLELTPNQEQDLLKTHTDSDVITKRSELNVDTDEDVSLTRSGRQIKPVKRLNLMNFILEL